MRQLFREYAAELNVDLCFQGFEKELAELPGKYAEPGGCVLLARAEEQIAGCVALRPFGGDACEMKRMFVRPEFRGCGIGERVAVEIIARGRRMRYQKMVLDTLAQLVPAIRLYERLGFRRIDPYYANPLNGVVYMELCL